MTFSRANSPPEARLSAPLRPDFAAADREPHAGPVRAQPLSSDLHRNPAAGTRIGQARFEPSQLGQIHALHDRVDGEIRRAPLDQLERDESAGGAPQDAHRFGVDQDPISRPGDSPIEISDLDRLFKDLALEGETGHVHPDTLDGRIRQHHTVEATVDAVESEDPLDALSVRSELGQQARRGIGRRRQWITHLDGTVPDLDLVEKEPQRSLGGLTIATELQHRRLPIVQEGRQIERPIGGLLRNGESGPPECDAGKSDFTAQYLTNRVFGLNRIHCQY